MSKPRVIVRYRGSAPIAIHYPPREEMRGDVTAERRVEVRPGDLVPEEVPDFVRLELTERDPVMWHREGSVGSAKTTDNKTDDDKSGEG